MMCAAFKEQVGKFLGSYQLHVWARESFHYLPSYLVTRIPLFGLEAKTAVPVSAVSTTVLDCSVRR